MQQTFFMSMALELAQKARLTAPPNPWVGAVIVQEGKVVGRGYTQPVGGLHAEAMALQEAAERAKGAEIYVTLEPCSHEGRTPPCADQLIAAGVKKVFIPFVDPDEKVSGSGIKKLQTAGIEVVVGLLQKEAEELLRPYLHHRRTQKPYTILKVAASLDGKIADQEGKSRWITESEARLNVHQLRAESQAILVGSQTAIIDQPQLTVRGLQVVHQAPLRVILDRSGRLEPVGPLADVEQAPTLVFTNSHKRKEEWQKKGVQVEVAEGLDEVLQLLGKRGIMQLLVEGGAKIHSAFLQEGLFDQMTLYTGALVMGGLSRGWSDSLLLDSLDKAKRLHLLEVKRLGNDVRLDYRKIIPKYKKINL